MRQIIYISTATAQLTAEDPAHILDVSSRRNTLDAITGLLYFDGKRFLQALEGESDALDRVLARIETDPRHRAIVILSDRSVAAREFGNWAMARRSPGLGAEHFLKQVADLVGSASPSVQATFNGFAEVRNAA